MLWGQSGLHRVVLPVLPSLRVNLQEVFVSWNGRPALGLGSLELKKDPLPGHIIEFSSPDSHGMD